MGWVLKLHFLPEVRKALEDLEPGAFTAPIGSFAGFRIFLKETLEREDLAEILREEFERKTYLDTMRKIQSKAKIVRSP